MSSSSMYIVILVENFDKFKCNLAGFMSTHPTKRTDGDRTRVPHRIVTRLELSADSHDATLDSIQPIDY